MNKIFLDLETTGLNYKKNDRIIEIFCLKVNKNKKSIFHHYLNTQTPIKKEAFLIHGIKNDFLKDKPLFKNICKEFLHFIKNSILIIHNSKFDLNFLNFQLKEMNLKNLQFYCYKIIDTLKFSRKFYKNKKNSLEFLCKRFNINEYNKRIKHSASIDTFLLYKIYIKLLEKFKIIKVLKIKNILKLKKIKKHFNNKIIKFSKKKENIINNFIINKNF